MKTATNYLTETTANMERAVLRMQPMLQAVPGRVALPTSPEAIHRYINSLLTDEEQRICEMATD